MKAGKLNWDDLKQIIDENRSVSRADVRVKSGIGEDCSIINYGDFECVISTDPITGAEKGIGKLAVNINCNDIAACGVEPIGILVTILAPEGTTLDQIKDVMKEVDEETKKLNVEILGGHTEITQAVNRIIVSCTALGKAKAGKAVATAGAQVGDDIIVTKLLGMEGTNIVVNDYEDKVKKFLSEDEIITAKGYSEGLSVVKEGLIAGEFGVHSMHDITEGGVLGALWELSEASNVGFKVYEEKMPVSSITKKICNSFSIDYMRFISSGSMIITAKNGEVLVEEFKKQGINASIIGNITKEKGILVVCHKEEEVLPPERDELFVLMERI